jgi:hypothetical protein
LILIYFLYRKKSVTPSMDHIVFSTVKQVWRAKLDSMPRERKKKGKGGDI